MSDKQFLSTKYHYSVKRVFTDCEVGNDDQCAKRHAVVQLQCQPTTDLAFHIPRLFGKETGYISIDCSDVLRTMRAILPLQTHTPICSQRHSSPTNTPQMNEIQQRNDHHQRETHHDQNPIHHLLSRREIRHELPVQERGEREASERHRETTQYHEGRHAITHKGYRTR